MASSPRIEELKKKFDENPRRYFAPLANEFRKTGDYDQAILICQEFLPQQPGHMSGHIVFGQALFEAGRMDEARSVFETALTLDPENLIALRHLGDISRAGGDVEGARSWYRRVLDADPRNEEIASLLASLDEPASVAWTSPTPKSSAVVETPESHAPPPVAAAPSEAENPLETAPAESQPVDFDAMMTQAMSAGIPAAQPEPAAAPDSDLLELEENEITFGPPGSAPPDDLGVERAQETPAGFENMTSTPTHQPEFPSIEGLETGEFMPSERAASAAHESALAQPNAGEDEPASIDNSFESFELATTAETPAQPRPPREEDTPVAAAPTPAPEPAPAPHEHEDAHGRASRASASGFVTETMAELYVQQGHVAEAIGVYQQLVQRYPGDEVLRARLVELENTASQAATKEMPAATTARQVSEPAAREEVTPVAASPVPPSVEPPAPIDEVPTLATDTPTIRDFLGAIASYRPGVGAAARATTAEDLTPADEEEVAAPADEVTPLPTYEVHVAAEAVAAEEPAATADEPLGDTEEELEPPDEPKKTSSSLEFLDLGESDETERAPVREERGVGGSIDALFTGAESSDADEAAASRLAGAFARDNGEEEDADSEQAMSGNPARRAQDELSLDHVFRERATSADRGQPAFSFDQFFSQSSAERAGAAPAEQAGTPTASPDDDIQQFNAWLEGLKKT